MIETKAQLDEIILNRLDNGRGRCVSEGSFCRYRLYGNACAIGHLIPDELYDESIEGVGISYLTTDGGRFSPRPKLAGGVQARAVKLANILNQIVNPQLFTDLRTWQRRHDNHNNWRGNKYVGPRD